jgi:hypothetical protein
MSRTTVAILFALLLPLSALRSYSQSSNPNVELLIENAEVKVTRYTGSPGQVVEVKASGGDAVVVPAGAVSWAPSPADSSPLSAVRGDAIFVAEGNHVYVRQSEAESSFVLYGIDLKHHWQSTLRKCEEPKECARPITIAGQVIGETRKLFTNNYVSAFRHELEKDGTLNSSYFTSRGTDHVLFIALTRLAANFSGEELKLDAGQVYFSKAQEVEVSALSGRALWVVIRIHASATTDSGSAN